jgi:hypothetical protein
MEHRITEKQLKKLKNYIKNVINEESSMDSYIQGDNDPNAPWNKGGGSGDETFTLNITVLISEDKYIPLQVEADVSMSYDDYRIRSMYLTDKNIDIESYSSQPINKRDEMLAMKVGKIFNSNRLQRVVMDLTSFDDDVADFQPAYGGVGGTEFEYEISAETLLTKYSV